MRDIEDFTIYFADYLEDNELPECLDLMPDDDSGTTFKDRLIIRNLYKEIGTETEELFKGLMENKARECVNKYQWKIQEYLDNRDTLLDKFVTLSETAEINEGKEEEHSDNGSKQSDIEENGQVDRNLQSDTSGNYTKVDDGNTTQTQDITESTIDSANSSTTTVTDGTVTHNTYLNPIDTSSTTLESKSEDITDSTVKVSGESGDNKTVTTNGTIGTETNNTETDEHSDTQTDVEGTTTTNNSSQTDTTSNNGKSNYTIERNESRTHQELYRAFKSMPEMIELTNNLELLYEKALQSFDVLFMGVL